MPPRKLLFLTLNTFSSTGGIEKVCQVAGKALSEIVAQGHGRYFHFALNDKASDLAERYVNRSSFFPFSGQKIRYAAAAVSRGLRCDLVVLSHIHLLPIGGLIKLLSPKTKVLLIAHGIEVWKPLPSWKTHLLRRLDAVLAVSEFTMQKMLSFFGLEPKKCIVLNNCLDPYLQPDPLATQKAVALRKRFGLSQEDLVLFTLTRLKSTEQYKGYDQVIRCLPDVLTRYPNVKYLIAGKYDETEKQRLDQLIADTGISDKVHFAGFVRDEEIPAYFSFADVYVMPSSGEGFGIVFIEALYYGKPVIAGNQDGSVDALNKGRFGLLVNPNDSAALTSAILSVLKKPAEMIPSPADVLAKFGYDTYRSQLAGIINEKQNAVS